MEVTGAANASSCSRTLRCQSTFDEMQEYDIHVVICCPTIILWCSSGLLLQHEQSKGILACDFLQLLIAPARSTVPCAVVAA